MQFDFRWSIARLHMDVPCMARPSLPQMFYEEVQHQLVIMCCIRACTLTNGFLGPGDGIVLASVSKFGLAVWWSFVQWACLS